jgi:hypothetical protein
VFQNCVVLIKQRTLHKHLFNVYSSNVLSHNKSGKKVGVSVHKQLFNVYSSNVLSYNKPGRKVGVSERCRRKQINTRREKGRKKI